MQPTRRCWTTAAVAAFLGAWGLFLGSWLVVAGGVGVAAWLLAHQLRFARQLDDVLPALAVDQRPSRTRVSADETVPVTLTVEHDIPLPIGLSIAPSPPAGAVSGDETVTLDPGETRGEAITDVTWPVAGRFSFDEATVRARDAAGLFEQRFAIGTTPTVTVEARGPRNIHVGEGGDAIAAGFGEHEAGRLGSGLEPAEVRKYVPGDAVRRIDWKATARLDEPHVREFEAETDRETVLVVDHRPSLAVGPPGETALDYLRQVALAHADSARELADPLGCLTVDENGLTGSFRPQADADHHTAIRRHLQRLETRATESSPPDESPPQTASPYASSASHTVAPATSGAGDARRLLGRLDGDDPFDRTLRPFFDRPAAYVEQVETDPLYAAIQTATTRFAGRLWTVICTDDTRRTEVREAVKLARRGEGRVLVFLAPAVLYELGGLADVDEAFERYRQFDGFRRELAGMERVRAFEVGPADRLATILATGQPGRRSRGTTR